MRGCLIYFTQSTLQDIADVLIEFAVTVFTFVLNFSGHLNKLSSIAFEIFYESTWSQDYHAVESGLERVLKDVNQVEEGVKKYFMNE
jgi:hypothetical protein